ncbi:MAG TPA: methyltransferase domain-containing protein [Candidatus Angelobacter sp.]|nr:methyltransferase domain-containing protein [Candidatus Angelobacter sp.]
MQRHVVEELLDHDLGTHQQIVDALEDLNTVNRWFGGTYTATKLLRSGAALTGKKEFSLLEVGAGSGYVPLFVQERLERQGTTINVTLLDCNWTHLPANGVPSVTGNALRLPFRDGAFDLVSCSIFTHHFDPDPLRHLLAEALRVSRTAVVFNDLIRSRLHLLLVYLWLPFFRSRMSWNDGPASVRAAYTVPEMKSILADVPARRISVSRHYLYRMGVVIEK